MNGKAAKPPNSVWVYTPHMQPQPSLTQEHLRALIADGEVDTVVVAFPDLQGRLIGKRVSGWFFLEQVAESGTENCDYLIATDIEDHPVPGYRFTNYERGYGDMVAFPDWDTLRLMAWHDRTALVICDLLRPGTQIPIEVAPRQILRAQVEAAAAEGFDARIGTDIEFYLFADSYAEAHGNGYRDLTPGSPWLQDYQIVQTGFDEPVIGDIRRHLEASAVPVESSKGEAGRGQHEINIQYSHPLETADRNLILKAAAKEVAAQHGCAVTFMAKWHIAETGSSGHIHSSLWNRDDGLPSFAGAEMPEVFRHYLAGLLATAREFSLLWAPTVNSYRRFQSESWAPTAVAWGHDNRTVGLRVVGHGAATRVESRIPGADMNSYLALAGTLAGGLYGIRHALKLPGEYQGNAYADADLVRIPTSLHEAIHLWENSEIALECFGEDVHHHILTMATAEWNAFGRTVTDWELSRYFERI
jgi:glutamine synthetase